jgi:hypothetical protein
MKTKKTNKATSYISLFTIAYLSTVIMCDFRLLKAKFLGSAACKADRRKERNLSSILSEK